MRSPVPLGSPEALTNSAQARIHTMSVPITQASRGNVFEMDGALFEITGMDHVKPGKGPAYIQVRYKSLTSGRNLEKRFNSSHTIDLVHVDERKLEYLYREGSAYVFMDTDTYDQIHLSADLVADKMAYLKENDHCTVSFRDSEPLSVVLPAHVVLRIAECDPPSKAAGTNATKPATLETGLEVRVPLFVGPGTLVKVDTRSGEFVERVKE
jgi:elongation factor P